MHSGLIVNSLVGIIFVVGEWLFYSSHVSTVAIIAILLGSYAL